MNLKKYMIQNREKKIIRFLLLKGITQIKHIAKYMQISEKTVANSLKIIDDFLRNYQISVIRKPKIGVYINGDKDKVYQILRNLDNQHESIPIMKEDRVITIFLILLKTNDYVTIQDLSEELYISRGTIEKDLLVVEEFLKKEGLQLHRKPGRGIKLQISERQKRILTASFIQKFWGNNWYLKQEDNRLLQSLDDIPATVKKLFLQEGLKKIINIIREFCEVRSFNLSDYSFQSIVIHLAIAVERIRKGKYIEIEDRYVANDVFQIVQEDTIVLACMLEEQLMIAIPKTEKRYINIHLAAAYNQASQHGGNYIGPDLFSKGHNSLRNLIVEIVRNGAYDDLLLEGLITHVRAAIGRFKLGMNIKNPFIDDIKRNFTGSFKRALNLKKRLEDEYKLTIDDHEMAYIALHFEAHLERVSNVIDELRIVLVCSTGIGSSRLLAARINKYFPKIKIQKILSVQELVNEEIDADLIISTIYLDISAIPTIIVSPIMGQRDVQLLERKISTLNISHKQPDRSFRELIKEENIFLQLDVRSMTDVIYILGTHLIYHKYAKEGVVESAIEREKLSFTSFNDMAIPHANMEFIKKSTIVIATLKKQIQWGENQVNKIFFIALNKEHSLDLDKVYTSFFNYLDYYQSMRFLERAKASSDVLRNIVECEKFYGN